MGVSPVMGGEPGTPSWGMAEPGTPCGTPLRSPIPGFPIPDSLFPIPDSRFPIPDFLFPVPYSLFPIPDFPFTPCAPRRLGPHPALAFRVTGGNGV